MSAKFHRTMYESLRKKDRKPNPAHTNKERNSSIKKICAVLKKPEHKRTLEEKELLSTNLSIVREAELRLEKRQKLKDRIQEVEDSDSVLIEKCQILADAVQRSNYLVVYTGAGISTAARIPDYRGTSGIWTLLQQGKDIGLHDLTQAEPTYTHMALSELHKKGKLKHVVSQNCDGLHLRSGLPRKSLSEVHGNMYIEVCKTCKPSVEYLRLFDVTENTGRFCHKTLRRCYKCNSPLTDSIVHFGERGNLPWPLNWSGACKAAERADVILCIGSSLKVLKRYPWLWSMDKPQRQRPHLYIINLQWTPKDCHATVKINGKCDNVMKILMKCLNVRVPEYKKTTDPIFVHATELCKEEQHTTNRPCLRMEAVEGGGEVKKEEVVEEESGGQSSGDPGGHQDGEEDKKEKCIVITIKSEENFEKCCRTNRESAKHDADCMNHAGNNLPVTILPSQHLHNFNFANMFNFNYTNMYNYNYFSYLQSLQLNEYLYNYLLLNSAFQHQQSVLEDTGSLPQSPIPLTPAPPPPPQPITADDNKDEETTIKCEFCYENYRSRGCLFYARRTSGFGDGAGGRGGVCECCDSGGDDDEEPELDTEDEVAKNDGDVKTVSNPGWYGKGCRKKIRKKR